MTVRNLFAQLQHRDPAVRSAARRLLLETVERLQGDLRAAAAELRVSSRTVRKHLTAAQEERRQAAAAPPGPPVREDDRERENAPAERAETLAHAAAGDDVPVAPAPPAADLASALPALAPIAPQARRVAQFGLPARATPPPPPPAPPSAPRHTGGRSPFTDFQPGHRMPLGAQPQAPAAAAPPTAAAGWAAGHAAGDRPAARAAHGEERWRGPDPAGAGGATPRASRASSERASSTGAAADAPLARGRLTGEWPHHQPGAAAARVDGDGARSPRRLAFVLHAHLPWVLGHGTWPHGEEWLAEAVVHCYLPLLGALRRLAAEGRHDLLTLSVSPVLAAQLDDARTPPLVRAYLAQRLEAARSLAAGHPLGRWWEERYAALAADWEAIDGALVPALAALARDGAVELSTCAVTHGYLPLLHRREHVALQVRAAAANHTRWFGAAPAGLWMPECAYRPGGPWEHPVTAEREAYRPGNEAFLAAARLRWTVVDAQAVLGGEPVLPYPGFLLGDPADAPAGALAAATAVGLRLQPCRIAQSAVAALPREPHTAQQVWSRQGGYPGDPRYLDFHKRQAETGLRLWRVTDAAGDLGDKLPYHPEEARAAAREQAEHFVSLVAALPGVDDGLVACPYDAELFGHWWLEGVDWLEEVLRRSDGGTVTTTTPARELVRHPPAASARLVEGSWGEAGDHRMWVNDATAWMWEDLRDAETAVDAALAGLPRATARAALAQLLLMAASDWPFLVTSGTAADYAAERFARHRDRLRELLAAAHDAPLPQWAAQDLAGVELDPAWWEEPSA